MGQRIRTLWTIYWALWFAVVPFVLACVFVKVLTPPSGVDAGGVIGWIESIVAEQAVPVGIVAFTLFEMALWAVRHQLPFAKHAYTPLRADIPEALRRPFERARLLLDDANTILTKKEKDVVRDLSAREREELRADLDQLQTAMDKDPFDQEVFVDSLVKADAQVDERLRRWRKSELREYMESILVAIGVALALRAFVLEAFKIPSGSMIPTLQVGDHIFVNKFIYGPAIPFTHSRLWSSLPPKRGDVMVHAFPEHPEQDFIKRVIAIPGDKLEARNGHPVINGWEVPHCYVGEYSYVENESPVPNHDGDLFVEYLGEAAYLTLYDHATGGFPEYQGPFLAKPGEVWVMGDNRNNSHDSRMWWNGAGGGVPFENIRGRAIFVWLSVNEGKVDWSRFGAPVTGRPRLPPDMHALQPALDKCLKDRPPLDKTTPPPPSPTQGQLSSP